MTTSAQILFERIVRDGYAGLEAMKQEQAVETQIIDFKTVKNNKASNPMATDDKKNLAKALGGFANSDGGVIVWGADARKTSEGLIDGIKELKPIENVALFHNLLGDMSAQLIEPYVDGIRHEIIKKNSSDTAGMVATYAPKWDALPVMSKGKEQYTFFCRVGPNFMPMDHWMLADRFGRRPQPKLIVKATKVLDKSASHAVVHLSIVNEGLGIAEKVLLSILRGNPDFPMHSASPKREDLFRTSTSSDNLRVLFQARHDTYIHPYQEISTCTLSLAMEPIMQHKHAEIDYGVFCEGQAKRDVLKLSLEDLGL